MTDKRDGPVTFTVMATCWLANIRAPKDHLITIVKTATGVTVDGKAVKMEFTGIQLRFTDDKSLYIVFDDIQQPMSIAKMYKALK